MESNLQFINSLETPIEQVPTFSEQILSLNDAELSFLWEAIRNIKREVKYYYFNSFVQIHDVKDRLGIEMSWEEFRYMALLFNQRNFKSINENGETSKDRILITKPNKGKGTVLVKTTKESYPRLIFLYDLLLLYYNTDSSFDINKKAFHSILSNINFENFFDIVCPSIDVFTSFEKDEFESQKDRNSNADLSLLHNYYCKTLPCLNIAPYYNGRTVRLTKTSKADKIPILQWTQQKPLTLYETVLSIATICSLSESNEALSFQFSESYLPISDLPATTTSADESALSSIYNKEEAGIVYEYVGWGLADDFLQENTLNLNFDKDNQLIDSVFELLEEEEKDEIIDIDLVTETIVEQPIQRTVLNLWRENVNSANDGTNNQWTRIAEFDIDIPALEHIITDIQRMRKLGSSFCNILNSPYYKQLSSNETIDNSVFDLLTIAQDYTHQQDVIATNVLNFLNRIKP